MFELKLPAAIPLQRTSSNSSYGEKVRTDTARVTDITIRDAGRIRVARLSRNSRGVLGTIPLVIWKWETVTTYPEITKKISTPAKPLEKPTSAWYKQTAITETARSSWMSSRRCELTCVIMKLSPQKDSSVSLSMARSGRLELPTF